MTAISRRASLGALALPWAARHATAAGALNIALESEVVILDPHATTAAITRTFATQVFDTLFAMDAEGMIRPQMVESWQSSADGLTWDFSLRPGLAWHDGLPVTATDCIASLERWAPRDALGRMLWAAKAEIGATGPTSFRITLRTPFPLMLDVLGKPNAPLPVMLPARLAAVPVETRIREIIGSGPFRFRAADWRPGASMVLERNPDYRPRAEPSSFLAGGRHVKIDQMTWRAMPDQATGATALMAGELDYMQYLPFDWITRLERARGVRLLGLGGIHQFQGNFRLNHATPPFDDPAIRRVLWHCADQASILTAIGVPPQYRAPPCPSFFLCDSPLESRQGAEAARFDPAAARAALAATSYRGQPIAFLTTQGGISQTAAQVMTQAMQQAGFVVQEQVMDWGTLLARRARREGWNMFSVYANGTDLISPLTHFYVANTCADFPGWDCDQGMRGLIDEFARAGDGAARRALAGRIQAAAVAHVPSVMWGQFTIPAGYRDRLRNLPRAAYPMFWDVEV